MLKQGAKEVVLGFGSGEVEFIRKNYKNNVLSIKWPGINWIYECLGDREIKNLPWWTRFWSGSGKWFVSNL